MPVVGRGRLSLLKRGRSVRWRGRGRAMSSRAEGLTVMVNGAGGRMGQEVGDVLSKRGIAICGLALSGAGSGGSTVVAGNTAVRLVRPEDHRALLAETFASTPDLIVVDYTLPSAVTKNCELYCELGVPFVLGTTGGDREALVEMAKQSGTYSVIAPQMGKQVVALQAMLEEAGSSFPGAFEGYKLDVVESHQSGKADTSGTAKAVVSSFLKLGIDNFEVGDIRKVRTKEKQAAMGVPEDHLGGHAFHTYTLTSPDGLVSFQFQHNVCGRSIYAEGTVDAVEFLHEKISAGSESKVYSMIDVLKEGAMR